MSQEVMKDLLRCFHNDADEFTVRENNGKNELFFFFFAVNQCYQFFKCIFNQRIIALQCYVGVCHTAM